MKIAYDRKVDAAYIHLDQPGSSSIEWTYACDPLEVEGQIQLDFDAEGRLVGIEVLDASKKLPPGLI